MRSDPWSILTQNKTSCLTTAFLKISPPYFVWVLALVPLLASGPDSAVTSHALVWSRGTAKDKSEIC